jgi:hypothetical protein
MENNNTIPNRIRNSFPSWLYNTIPIILGAIVLTLSSIIWDDRIAGVKRDGRIALIEENLAIFKRPGKRYSAQNGRDDRATVKELRNEFYRFKESGSRAADDIIRLQDQIDNCIILIEGFRITLVKLKTEIVDYESVRNRALPLVMIIQRQIDENKESMKEINKHWIQCIRSNENVKGRLDFLEQIDRD